MMAVAVAVIRHFRVFCVSFSFLTEGLPSNVPGALTFECKCWGNNSWQGQLQLYKKWVIMDVFIYEDVVRPMR